MIDVCTLGTGGAIPLPDRALSSLYLRMDGRALLIDCGEGTQTQIRRLGWGFKSIEAVLLTHYHADHCGGLPGFLLSMAKTGREEPLAIYGPSGLHRLMDACRVFAPALPFPVALYELPMEETAFSLIGLEITAFPLAHGMPCLGYDVRLNRRPAFSASRATALQIPRPMWKLLQRGDAVTVNGQTVQPCEVMGAPRRGLHLLFATDTRPVEAIVRLGADADLMILEGMYADDKHLPQAIRNHHMLYREAAVLARDAGARQLLLTHFSNSVTDPEEGLALARAVMPDTSVASDLMCLTLAFDQRNASA